ncbi:MAG: hypothetical protein RLZZ272_1274 [Actinomycetota bacterium]
MIGPEANDGAVGPDPFAPIEASSRGASVLVALAGALSLAAVVTGLAALAGPLGMVAALVAHVKGHRAGMPMAVVAGLATIVGMTVVLYLR